MFEFLNMGEYGSYIWPAYLITFVVMGVMLFLSRRAYVEEARRLAHMEQSKPE
jgi:heme exporter protein CcmD